MARLQVGTHLGTFCCWKAMSLVICPNPGKNFGLRIGSLDLVQCPQELALAWGWSLTLWRLLLLSVDGLGWLLVVSHSSELN